MVKKKFYYGHRIGCYIHCSIRSLNYSNSAEHVTFGSDNSGYVTKDVYNDDKSDVKVAVITGIHPRVTLSVNVSSNVVKDDAQSHDVETIQYNVVVKENPDYVRS